jgi:uncharacterized membrane protein
MGVLIVLNIVWIVILLTILVLYLFKNKKDAVQSVCINESKCEEIKRDVYKQKKSRENGRVFEGVFVTDGEYQQMTKNRKSDISILLEETNREYEHLKELNK